MIPANLIPSFRDEKVNPDFCGAILVAYFHCVLIFISLGLQLVLSSGRDKQHGNTSLHFPGHAFDILMLNVDMDGDYLVGVIKNSLNVHFDVIYNPDTNCIHVEWQLRGNLIFK